MPLCKVATVLLGHSSKAHKIDTVHMKCLEGSNVIYTGNPYSLVEIGHMATKNKHRRTLI